VRALRNNPNRAHNYFQDFSKCLSIFNKALKLQKNRKRKQTGKRGRESLPGAHPAGPPAGPAQPTLQRAAWLGQAGRQLLDAGTSACHAAARRPASSPRRSASLDDLHGAHRTPWTHPFPLPLSLAPLRHGRRSRRRSAAVTVPTIVNAPLHRVLKLRHSLLDRPTEPRPAGGPRASSPSSSSTSVAGDPPRRPARSSSSPTSPSALSQPP